MNLGNILPLIPPREERDERGNEFCIGKRTPYFFAGAFAGGAAFPAFVTW